MNNKKDYCVRKAFEHVHKEASMRGTPISVREYRQKNCTKVEQLVN
jgi:hypothetical protein